MADEELPLMKHTDDRNNDPDNEQTPDETRNPFGPGDPSTLEP